MRSSIYVIFDRNGINKMCKTASFSLSAGERAVEVVIEVDNDIFQPVQIPKIEVKVPKGALITRVETIVTEEEQEAKDGEWEPYDE